MEIGLKAIMPPTAWDTFFAYSGRAAQGEALT
jgi:hypothetical protein